MTDRVRHLLIVLVLIGAGAGAAWTLLGGDGAPRHGGRYDVLAGDISRNLKLSRHFSIEYYGRDASRDLLVYLFQQPELASDF